AVDQFETDYRASFAKHGKGHALLGLAPRIALLPGVGLVAAGPDRQSAENAASNYRQVIQVMEAAEALDQFRFIDEASAFEFEYWPLAVADARRDDREFARHVALVTGAAGGIGFAVARRFALAGGHVVLTDVDPEAVRAAADAIASETHDPHRATAVAADAASEADAARAFDAAVRAYGGLDVLVCNAGYVRTSPITETSAETWERTLATNLTGAFLAVREAVRIMKAQGFGNIVLNASKAAFAPAAQNAPYAATKAGAAHLARCLAVELAPAGIRVNYVNADFVDTPLMRRVIAERAAQRGVSVEAQIEEYRRRNLLKVGPLPPEAVADAVLFLASPRAAYTTGGVITVDGGLTDAMPR
ncbi:MAG TPA: SDR family oxidoreductase, partial [Planctomycetota bacterium]|nr:SDR family oxidoreductase [Planctomycetota bacterium]